MHHLLPLRTERDGDVYKELLHRILQAGFKADGFAVSVG